jgi:hypothetical protein
MSGTFSYALESLLLDHVFAGTNYPPPLSINVALYAAAPDATGGGAELANPDYARMPVAFGPPSGAPPLIANPAAVQWPAAQSIWGTIVAGGLFDALVGGNFLGSAMLVDPTDGVTLQPKVIGVGDVFRIPIGNLVIGFVGPPIATSSIVAQGIVGPIRADVMRPPRHVR